MKTDRQTDMAFVLLIHFIIVVQITLKSMLSASVNNFSDKRRKRVI